MTETIFIPDRFRKIVTLHVVCNLMAETIGPTPLLLGIHGPPGVGKTFQCERLLEELGVDVFYVAESELESERAGQPAQNLRAAYESASAVVRAKRKQGRNAAAALVINDIDTGLGNWGELVQTTVNRQLVIGELMHIADYPTMVGNQSVERIPIILTGNDFTKLYQPILRLGRMRLFEWNPTADEMAEILTRLFPTFGASECGRMVQAFPGETITFFAQLRSMLLEQALWTRLSSIQPSRVIHSVVNGLDLTRALSKDVTAFISEGKALVQAGQLKSHLRGT